MKLLCASLSNNILIISASSHIIQYSRNKVSVMVETSSRIDINSSSVVPLKNNRKFGWLEWDTTVGKMFCKTWSELNMKMVDTSTSTVLSSQNIGLNVLCMRILKLTKL